MNEQFRRAVREGAIAALKQPLKQKILEAYAAVGRATQHVAAVVHGSREWAEASNKADDSICKAKPKIEAALQSLLEFLGSET